MLAELKGKTMWCPREEKEYDPDTDPNYEEPVFTVAEMERNLGHWRQYVVDRPTSKLGPLNVAYWERKLDQVHQHTDVENKGGKK